MTPEGVPESLPGPLRDSPSLEDLPSDLTRSQSVEPLSRCAKLISRELDATLGHLLAKGVLAAAAPGSIANRLIFLAELFGHHDSQEVFDGALCLLILDPVSGASKLSKIKDAGRNKDKIEGVSAKAGLRVSSSSWRGAHLEARRQPRGQLDMSMSLVAHRR